MSLCYQDERVTLINDDCIETMRTLPDNSVDSIVTDPPYGLGFMGKGWDALPPGLEWAEECLRVLKPGGHLLAFGGTRTWHRLAVAVEDAGFEIRDSFAWLYGSGFPKSMDLGKTLPKWEGWGTALKPAFEPVIMARKPFKGTVAANVLEHGTGALNIDASRIEGRERTNYGLAKSTRSHGATYGTPSASADFDASKGRHPANVLLDEHTAALLDEQSGISKSTVRKPSGKDDRGVPNTSSSMVMRRADTTERGVADSGGASRFFKIIKEKTCVTTTETAPTSAATGATNAAPAPSGVARNVMVADELGGVPFLYTAKASKSERPVVDGLAHPTVKPLAIMRYLVKLVTPPGGTVLEPFAGSGTTVEACVLEGFKCIAIEREAEYLPLIEARINRQGATDDSEPTFDIFEGAA